MKPENVTCPDCQAPMRPRNGPHGTFWGCSLYPTCKGTRDSMGRSKRERAEERRENPEPRQRRFEEQGPWSTR
jgi:DNA topoisomerase-3